MIILTYPQMLLKTTLVFEISGFLVNYYKFNLLTVDPNMKKTLIFHQCNKRFMLTSKFSDCNVLKLNLIQAL